MAEEHLPPPGLIGASFLEKITNYEEACAHTTAETLPECGAKARECYESLGMTLEFLDDVASCRWESADGDHLFEKLIGRAVNTAYAAINLTTRGYYDHALSLARTLGEIANLLALFFADQTKIDEWRRADDRTRRRFFSPIRVLTSLEMLKAPVPLNEERYVRLSLSNIHASSISSPPADGGTAQPITFPTYQKASFAMALNEIALPMAFVAVFTGKLVELPPETRSILSDLAIALSASLGVIES
jgi:hypothetical protein